MEVAAETGETVAEARRSERALSADERAEIQNALDWEGVYSGPIDADFGAGTRAAMRAWQEANGYDPTSVLTTAQRDELLVRYRAVLTELGVETIRDPDAGIEIALPMAVLDFVGHDAPFGRYDARDGGPEQALLISREGDADTLAGLYEVLQGLKIVPVDGPRAKRERSFSIEGRNDQIVSTTYAELVGGEIKGYTLVWPVDDEKRRTRVLDEMRATFTRLPGVLPTPEEPARVSGADLLAGLEVRRPAKVRSGFFVDAGGTILSSGDLNEGCDRLMLGDTPLDPVAADLAAGLVLLKPRSALRPLGYARIRGDLPGGAANVVAAGYTYEGRLPGPTVRFGQIDAAVATERDGAARLALSASPSAAGGPVLDQTGAVWGVLLSPPSGAALPENVSYAARPEAVTAFLQGHGVRTASAPDDQAMHPGDLTRRASEMTVAVTCWN